MLKLYNIIALIIVGCTLRAMDKSLFHLVDSYEERVYPQRTEEEELPPMLRILNKTPNKIVIRLQFEQEKPGALTLISEQAITVPYDKPLLLFKVLSYGKYRQWLNAHKLTFGWYEEPNKAAEVRKEFNGTRRLQVTIGFGGTFFGEGILRRIVGEFVPYQYGYKGFNTLIEHDVKKQECIVDIFPQVKFARENDLPILPRYVLCVPEEATEDECAFAHRVATWYWTDGEVDESLHGHVSSRFIPLIEKAYQALKSGDHTTFNEALRENRHIFMSYIEMSL